MEHKVFYPKGVCSKQMSFDYENGRLYNLEVIGGCNGNSKAIAKLIDGQEMSEIIKRLEGNTCGFKNTSCADQLVRAIKEVI